MRYCIGKLLSISSASVFKKVRVRRRKEENALKKDPNFRPKQAPAYRDTIL